MYDDLRIDVGESCIMVDLWQMGTISSWKIENTFLWPCCISQECCDDNDQKLTMTTVICVWQYRGAILSILDYVIWVHNDRRVIACLCLLTLVLRSSLVPCLDESKLGQMTGKLSSSLTKWFKGWRKTSGIVVRCKRWCLCLPEQVESHKPFYFLCLWIIAFIYHVWLGVICLLDRRSQGVKPRSHSKSLFVVIWIAY